jgi:hypothetical protein
LIKIKRVKEFCADVLYSFAQVEQTSKVKVPVGTCAFVSAIGGLEVIASFVFNTFENRWPTVLSRSRGVKKPSINFINGAQVALHILYPNLCPHLLNAIF